MARGWAVKTRGWVGDGVDSGKLRVGDRVVVPFPIACGTCATCHAELYSCCENTGPNAGLAENMFGHPTAGIFGYSHLTGGFAAAVRVRPGPVLSPRSRITWWHRLFGTHRPAPRRRNQVVIVWATGFWTSLAAALVRLHSGPAALGELPGEVHPRADVQLAEHLAEMERDGMRAEEHLAGDLLVGQTLGDQR